MNDRKHPEKTQVSKHRNDSGNGAHAVQKTEDEETLAEIKEMEEALERSNFTNSVLVPSHRDHGPSRKRNLSMRNHHKAVTTQVYHERTRVKVNARPVDWRMVLEQMATSTPEDSLEYIEDGIKIDIDKDVLTRVLKATGDDKFGAIRRRTGATIKVSRELSTLLLSGTRQAINRATEEFRNIAGRICVTRQYRPLEPGAAESEELGDEKAFFIPPLTRDEGAYHEEKRITQHVYLTPMPMEWTAKSLEDYVISLVDTYVDSFLHSPIYTPAPHVVLLDHERAVTRRIMRLFSLLPSEAGFSCSVVKLALSYMTKKGEKYLPQVRSLFALLDRCGIPMDTDVFNILLRAPVKTRNLGKFRQTITNMTRRGFVPNLDTWLLFLRMFDSVHVKAHILQAMNAKNMLGTPEAIQRIAQEMASHDAEHAAIQRKDLATFLEEQEDRYGPDWLTRDAGNKVLHMFSKYERYEDACKILDLMGERYHSIPKEHTHERLATRPDAKSFTSIISYAWIVRKVPLAVNVVRKMKTRKLARQPDAVILHLLFELAWRARLRTAITVIWRYASLARLTSYRMRQQVAALLSGEHGDPDDPEEPEMTTKEYHQLGGEALARELVGGSEVLERIRSLCRLSWGEKYPRGKLGIIATKILPVAFKEYGPAIALGTVLSQSVLVDFKCLHARKTNRLRDLLASAKVKSLPLWQRRKGEERWTDLARLDPTEPATIKHNDIWKDEWESQGWDAKPRIWLSEEWRDKFEEAYRVWQIKKAGEGHAEQEQVSARTTESETDEGQADEVENMQMMFAKAIEPLTEKRMAIINPMVWNDEKHDVSTMSDDHRTQLQRQNEEAILNALELVSKNNMSFRDVFADIESTLEGSVNRVPGETPIQEGEGTEVSGETEDPEIEAEDRLKRYQEMLKEIEGNMLDRPGSEIEKQGKEKLEVTE